MIISLDGLSLFVRGMAVEKALLGANSQDYGAVQVKGGDSGAAGRR
jgi:hypothetical protein